MGTQGHAFEGTRRAVEVLRAGVIGEVTELHVWTDRPAGLVAAGHRAARRHAAVPKDSTGTCGWARRRERPYNPAYVPFKWRGFWDFGTGAIGDMGIHNLDTAFWGLELGAPTSVDVKDCSPASDRPSHEGDGAALEHHRAAISRTRPAGLPVTMTWYDGGKLPPRELFQGEKLISRDGGSLVIGSKGTLFTRTWHGGQTDDGHVRAAAAQAVRWTTAAGADAAARRQPPSGVGRRLPRKGDDRCRTSAMPSTLTEALLVGNLALRTGKSIEWDSAGMRAVNCPEADPFIRPEFRTGWNL